jgi:hypothetical protein
MYPRATRQYWQGQYDALRHCARVLRGAADRITATEQMKRLASAMDTKARLTAIRKLGENPDDHPIQ